MAGSCFSVIVGPMRGERGLNRRSFFYRVTGTALGAGAAAIGISREAQAITDHDSVDPVNHGRGRGCQDGDPSDPSRCGRGWAQPLGFVLLITGVGAAAAGTYIRRRKS